MKIFMPLLVATMCLSGCNKDTSDPVNETFADNAFLAICLNHFDSDKDGHITLNEAATVKSIDINLTGVVSIRGIENFINLEYLSLYQVDYVETIDLQYNTLLKKLRIEGSIESVLKTVWIDKCDKLEVIRLDVPRGSGASRGLGVWLDYDENNPNYQIGDFHILEGQRQPM